jgi:hypothetical protein
MPPSSTRGTRARGTSSKRSASPKKKLTLREELIAAGKKREGPAAVDPDAILAEAQATLGLIDTAMDGMADAADAAQLRLAIEMGSTPDQIEEMKARLAARKVSKLAAQGRTAPTRVVPIVEIQASAQTKDVQPTNVSASEHPHLDKWLKSRPKGWRAPQDAKTRTKALQDGAPPAPESLMRCWDCFPDLPPATGFDWLGRGSPGEKDRPGQPMKRFLQPGPHRACSAAALPPPLH